MFRIVQYYGGLLSGVATWYPTFCEAEIPPRTGEYRGKADLSHLPPPRNWGIEGV